VNKRITELANQADREGNQYGRIYMDYGKFAELIVQDCISKVTKVSDSIKEFDPDNADGIDLCDLITYHIKKHFGVES
jgi:hypothetical protein